MPSKNMIRKGKRRQSVKAEYRLHRDALRDQASSSPHAGSPAQGEHAAAELHAVNPTPAEQRIASTAPVVIRYVDSADLSGSGRRTFISDQSAHGMRLDAYLSKVLVELSRSRIQTLIAAGQVLLDGHKVSSSTHLKGGEPIEIIGDPVLPPMHGEPENIPLNIVYEDAEFAVINKPAGMMVHAGSGSDEHNRGTLVNALLFHLGQSLSGLGGQLRPGIVHRLDKDTSGLILVAKTDAAHRRLAAQFSERTLHKTYIALLHGALEPKTGTVTLPISRDLVRRTRMTTRRADGRSAITHWRVLEEIDGPYGLFTLVELRIETGRTHQIRVHMQSLGYPVVGDTMYGAPAQLRQKAEPAQQPASLPMGRNFLHAAELQVQHPLTAEPLAFSAPLPPELTALLDQLRQ